MRPVDLTGRPLGICKVATRYRINPCPTPPPFFHPFFLLSTSFPPRPGQVSTLRRQFLPRKPPLQPATSWIATPTRGRMAKVDGRWTTGFLSTSRTAKNVLFRSRDLVYQLGVNLEPYSWSRQNDSKQRCCWEKNGYQSFKVVRKKQL